MKNNKILKGTVILIICNLVGKIIGALYRIPLARIVGSVGMGQYQLTFPLYCLMLTIATSGIPVALSKMVAEYNSKMQFGDSRRLLKVSVLVLTSISAIGTAVVFFGAKIFAGWQGNASNYICFYGIAPAILFVGVLSAFRGYFQGNLMMFPTAFSGIVEQVCKMIVGLFLARNLLVFGVEYAVFGALLGISISEFVATLFLLFCYIVYRIKSTANTKDVKVSYRVISRELFTLAVPMTLGGLVSPIAAIVDSLLAINLLMISGFSNESAMMMLGIQSGVVEPLVNIPVIIAVSISVVLLPNLSKLVASDEKEKSKEIIEKSFQITLSIAIACFICFVIFGEQILSFLFGGSLDVFELTLAMKLLFIGGVNIVFLSLVQVSASVLQGLGSPKFPVKTLIFGCIVKIVFDVILVPIKQLNILGIVISGCFCYFVVFLFNFLKIKKLTGVQISNSFFYISIQECFVCLFAFVTNSLTRMLFSDFYSLLISGIVTVGVFALTYYEFFIHSKNQEDLFVENKLT